MLDLRGFKTPKGTCLEFVFENKDTENKFVLKFSKEDVEETIINIFKIKKENEKNNILYILINNKYSLIILNEEEYIEWEKNKDWSYDYHYNISSLNTVIRMLLSENRLKSVVIIGENFLIRDDCPQFCTTCMKHNCLLRNESFYLVDTHQ